MAGKVSFQICYSKLLLNTFCKQTEEWFSPGPEQTLKVGTPVRSPFCEKVNNQKPSPFPKSIICQRINRCFGDAGVIKRKKMANDFFMGQLFS